MKTFAFGYIGSAIVFFGLDFIWLSTVATSFYKDRLGDLMMPQPNMTAAGIFYLVYIGGIVHFAVMPALQSGSWATALFNGALLGLVAYGTYDMTNLATLRGWPISVSLVDMAWGTTLTAVAAVAGTLAAGWAR